MTKPTLYCPECKNYQDRIIHNYDKDTYQEIWIWNDGEYELADTNICSIDYTITCKECGTELEEK